MVAISLQKLVVVLKKCVWLVVNVTTTSLEGYVESVFNTGRVRGVGKGGICVSYGGGRWERGYLP